jgi:thiol-disulfide isomerase/thioredoxin
MSNDNERVKALIESQHEEAEFYGKVTQLALDNFDELVKDGKAETWVIMFFSPLCSHCRKFAPKFSDLSLNKTDVKFAAVNM